ncbi:putative ABC transport system permease protein [Chitinophaga skermanii]|uniref:Putative ABC transport system permease protein n=1 Tax=Chitinophaga skermanii TaxID=331697 RepID=A0A327R2H0_9BACT|nr:ABC transporter permease [Chitinophaga skermanii]RAJ10821.1 putative ABC transport system permease protein [Chitinophaga skermanii]
MFKFWGTRNLNNLAIAFESLVANRLRSFLTALGIIFGVGAVIAMLAIGNGAQQEILDQMKLVGVNNIVIKPKSTDKDKPSSQASTDANAPKEEATKKKFSKGLTMADAANIQATLPTVENVSPEVVMDQDVLYKSRSGNLKLVGVDTNFFHLNNIPVDQGTQFNPTQLLNGEAVCILGSGVAKKFFVGEAAVGKLIKVGPQWLKVIGVTEEKNINSSMQSNLGIRDYNMDIYTPIRSLYIRYKNPAKQTFTVETGESGWWMDDGNNNANSKAGELDQLIVKIDRAENVSEAAEVITRMLKRRHNDLLDFEVTIPEQLLKQQQKTKDVFNIVLSAIAGISLLVGGIGIMNIMLASVLERTREIGIRMAIGAQKRDIIMQFLFEAVLISLTGGIIGIILGVVGAYFVDKVADINTIISGLSIFLSFVLASAVGVIFGISPAKKAANQNPIECLRHA